MMAPDVIWRKIGTAVGLIPISAISADFLKNSKEFVCLLTLLCDHPMSDAEETQDNGVPWGIRWRLVFHQISTPRAHKQRTVMSNQIQPTVDRSCIILYMALTRLHNGFWPFQDWSIDVAGFAGHPFTIFNSNGRHARCYELGEFLHLSWINHKLNPYCEWIHHLIN